MARFDRLTDATLSSKTGLKAWGQKVVEGLEAQLADITQALNAANASMPDMASIALTASSTGAVDPSSQLPMAIKFYRYDAETDVSSDATWSVEKTSGLTTSGTISADGTVTLTGMTAGKTTGSITGTSVHNGVTLSRTVSITKSNAPPPSSGSSGTGGTTGSVSTFSSINSTTPTTITSTITATAGTDGEVELSAPLTVSTAAVAPDGVFPVNGRWYWDNGGVWTALGSTVNSDPDCEVAEIVAPSYGGYPGDLTVNYTHTGRTNGVTYSYRFYAWNGSGTRTMSFSGTASAVGS